MFALSLFVDFTHYLAFSHHAIENIDSHTSLLTTLCVIHAARSGIISSVGARENGKKHLRVTDSKYRESLDRFEKSKTLKLCLKNAFREFSSKI